MRVDQAKRLKDLEKENLQLKKIVAELSLDKAILEEVNSGNAEKSQETLDALICNHDHVSTT